MSTQPTTFSRRAPAQPLRLSVIAGPALLSGGGSGGGGSSGGAIEVTESGTVVGKELQAKLRLEHPAVSRRHALLEVRNEQWYVTDLGSRNGTYLNGQRLEPHVAAPLGHGDHLRVSPWVFRCVLKYNALDTQTTADHAISTKERVEQVAPVKARSLAESQLEALISASAVLYGAKDEQTLVENLLSAALALTGFQRGAVLAQGSGGDTQSVEVVASRDRDGKAEKFEISRTLVQGAAEGKAVHLKGSGAISSHSIVSMEVSEAVCIPLTVDGVVWGFLYLDSRNAGMNARPVIAEAAQVARMLGDMGAQALTNVLRRDMESRFSALRQEAELAAAAQRLLLPPEQGRSAGLEYAVRFRPGRLVSGDIVGVVELDERRTAAFLGDVTGKGFGAGLVMTLIQSYLSASLRLHPDPGRAMDDLNRHLAKRLPDGCFASLWLGVFDSMERSLKMVDAGHGLGFCLGRGGARRLELTGGTWLGVDPGVHYNVVTIPLRPGDRVLVCSDGLAEQPGADGAQFGAERIMEAVGASASVAEDVDVVLTSLIRFAGTDSYRDDLTVASFGLRG